MGQLQPSISPGYGFTAIIVAFLGRLNPLGILIAGLVLALSYLGGEGAQIALKVPIDITRVIQGLLLFFVLACDALILYRLRLVPADREGRPDGAVPGDPADHRHRVDAAACSRRSANSSSSAPACSTSASRA